MALPSRFAPSTQLDALRTLLGDFSERDPGFQEQFEKSLEILRQLALPELGQRLASATGPKALRLRILQAVLVFDWPEWDVHLMHMLQPEADLELFDEGCAALGALCTRRAMEGLQRLKELRRDPERQEILDRELLRYTLNFAFEDHLAWLLEGAGNPVMAHMGARALAGFDGSEHLGDLMLAFQTGDALARHLILQVLAFHRDPDAEVLLLFLFREGQDDLADRRGLKGLLDQLEALSKTVQRGLLRANLEERFATRAPAALQALDLAVAERGPALALALDGLRAAARGPLEAYLIQAFALLAEGKLGSFQTQVKDLAARIPAHLAEDCAILDDIAALVAFKIMEGALPLEETLPLLEQAFHAGAGGEGLLIAYLRLVPADDRPRLERILAEPDRLRRIRCLEVLGSREEDRLVQCFLKAMDDPDVEVAHAAMHQLGKLPSALPVMMDLFRSGHLDRVRAAVQFFSENRTAAAAKPLQTFLASESPDELLVDAVHALGNLADPSTANSLLAQLHSGKPLLLQVALVEALTRLNTAQASLGLLKKSAELTLPSVLLLALKGSLAAFPGFEQPFPPDQVPVLEHLIERCCDSREGAGKWLTAAQCVQELYVFDQGLYDRLRERFNTFLSAMHHKPSWDRKSHNLALEILKKLARRAGSLSKLEDRERALEALIEGIPPAGALRFDGLLRLQETLSDPELVLSQACAQRLVAFLETGLQGDAGDFRELELLCDLAGLSGQPALIEPLREVYAHGASPGRRAFARKALLVLGLTDKEVDRRLPIKRILLLEPNAFFLKRMQSALEHSERTVVLAHGRKEAEAALLACAVDLVISESQDAEGDLVGWLERMWTQRRCRYVLASTANHDLPGLADKPWVIGRLYKPYPIEDLQQAIEG